MGKGRQRESSYLNEGVVELDDILHLKRRSAGSSSPTAAAPTTGADLLKSGQCVIGADPSSILPLHAGSSSSSSPVVPLKKKKLQDKSKTKANKRRRLDSSSLPTTTTTTTTRTSSPFVISEDEQDSAAASKNKSSNIKKQCQQQQLKPQLQISLDLTKPDDEILAGCNALLGLSNQTWVF